MTTLIGLFSDQQKAEAAVETLSAAELDDIEFKTVSRWEQEKEPELEIVGGLSSGTMPSGVPVAGSLAPSWNLNDEETQYFKRAVQHGGVLIVVDVEDEDKVPRVRAILEETGEKVTAGS